MLPLLVLFAQVQAANADLGYRIAIPAGFVAFPEGKTQPGVVDCWTEAGGQDALVLCVHRLHRVLQPSALRKLDLPADNSLRGVTWKGFELEAQRLFVMQKEQRVFVISAQVPLRREGVELTIGGPATEEPRGRALMTATLATFDGETNWLSEDDRSTRRRNIALWWTGIAVAAVIVHRWRKRRMAAA